MKQQETLLWQSGTSDSPLPPMVDPQDMRKGGQLFLEQYRKLGPIFRISRPGGTLTVMAGPEANAFIARYENEFFTTREIWQDFDAAMHSNMSDARDGEANRQRRTRESRSYSRARVLDQLPRMIEITRESTRDWQPGASIEVLASMRRVVSEQLGQLLVGYGPGDYLQDFLTFLNTAITSTIASKQPGDTTLSSPEYRRAQERVQELGRVILAARRAAPSPNGKPDLMDDVLAEATKHPEKYTEEALERAGLGPFFAGLDTVANSCSFMFFALLKHQDVLQRVLAEVDFAEGLLTWEKLKNMPALRGTAMETLRRYPVASSHRTRVAKPFTFTGYRLEPGETVIVAMTVSHFLPELFPEPEKFDIDRYTEPRNEQRQRGAFAPFGLGEHSCLGAGIAEIQLMVILATLLHSHQLALDPPDYELQIEYDPTPTPGKNFRIQVVAAR